MSDDGPPSGPSPDDLNMINILSLGGLLDDLELTRIGNGNRIQSFETQFHGARFPHTEELHARVMELEHDVELELIRACRKHRLAPFGAEYRGLGEKSLGRLLACIGDPADRPTVSKLWAYCGHGDPARKRRKGMTQEEAFTLGNPRAKKQVYLIAVALLKAGVRTEKDADGTVLSRHAISPSGERYLAARERYSDRVHETPCKRCGPAGHPAAEGTPWSAAHQHAAALRYVGKQFLKDLWIAARHAPPD